MVDVVVDSEDLMALIHGTYVGTAIVNALKANAIAPGPSDSRIHEVRERLAKQMREATRVDTGLLVPINDVLLTHGAQVFLVKLARTPGDPTRKIPPHMRYLDTEQFQSVWLAELRKHNFIEVAPVMVAEFWSGEDHPAWHEPPDHSHWAARITVRGWKWYKLKAENAA
jgi:hypothetical protein